MKRGIENSLCLIACMIRASTILVLVLVCASPKTSFAQAPPQAQKVAEEFARSKVTSLKSSSSQIFDQIADYNDIWIFESSDPKAFVLVKKEKEYSIAGYSFDNTFFKNGNIPEPALLCLEAIQNISLKDMTKHSRLKSYPRSIDPLLTTKWGQDCYFNYECPTDYGGPCDHVAVGCVPVAMGQIVKYYSRFNKVVFEDKFESDKYPNETIVFGNYDWDKMAEEPICIDLEVSRLLYHIGVVSKVLYNPAATSTSTYNAWVAFGKMSYLESLRMVRSQTDPAVWIDGFYSNISEFMPMFVAGSGHAFVCDGYDTEGFFHFNLGWGGSADGYYPLIGTGSPMISESLMKLRPHSLVLPPVNMQFKGDDLDSLTWAPHPYADILPFKYRVYQDDKEFAETESTSFPANSFEHGKHMIKVSAWYVNGESRWIGPLEIYNPGIEVNVPDARLRRALNKAIGLDEIDSETHIPRADELISLKQLSLDEQVQDLSGIEYCRGLLELQMNDNQGAAFDLKQLNNNKKLKILNIDNASIEHLDEITTLNQLVYLKLNKVALNNIDFLPETTDLLDLTLTNSPIPEMDSIIRLDRLEYLDLSNTGLQDAAFVNQLATLKGLNLSNNLLEEFILNEKLSKLRFVNFNNNSLEEMNFIESIPGIVCLEMDENIVKSLELFKTYEHLEKLSFANNEIVLLKANHLQPRLIHVNLSDNQITNIDRLLVSAPDNQWLDLSYNAISTIWEKSYQHLTYLNLSNNFITNIENIRLNPSLIHLDLSHNGIGDFYPLSRFNFYENFEFLNLTGNPASKESYQDFFPLFEESVDSISLDNTFTSQCPSYPSPLRESNISESSAILNWECENQDQNITYDLFFGEPGQLELLGSQLSDTRFPVEIDTDRRYQWQVIAHSPDSIYPSGIFNFRTFPPLELPFYEDFEEYEVNNLISLESPHWITKNKDYNQIDDGLVVSFRHFSGKNALKLQGNSHLILPLDHFSGEVLFIECALLISSGQIACIRLTELTGIKLEVYFKVNKNADVLVNDKVVSSFGYLTDKWIPVRISLSGKRNRIYVQVDGSTSFARDWKFPKNLVTIQNIEFSGERSPNFPSDGYPMFYIDDLTIRELHSTSIEPDNTIDEDISLFPNPVGDEVWVSGSSENPITKIFVVNIQGQRVREILNHTRSGDTRINTSDLPTGLYFLYYETSNSSGHKKMIVRH